MGFIFDLSVPIALGHSRLTLSILHQDIRLQVEGGITADAADRGGAFGKPKSGL